MGRPKSSLQRQRFNMQMWPEDRARLDRLALGYGLRHGEAVSAAQMIEWLIREAPDPLQGADFGEETADYLHERQPFRATYRSAKGNEYCYEIYGGKILSFEAGGMLLGVVPVPPENRENDSPELPLNWLLRLDRVIGIEALPEQRWMELPKALATFCLSPSLAASYRSHPEDQGTESQEDGSLLVRRWYAHRWELRSLLLGWGTGAQLLTPLPFRQALAHELQQTLSHYVSDT